MSNFETGSRTLYKVVLLGDGGVGKTSIRYQYLGHGFQTNYMATIGADFAIKKLNENNIIQIWDLAGQERFSIVREGYYLGTKGAFLVYDITRPDTFHSIPKWIGELMENISDEDPVPLTLVGNKADLRELDSPNFVSEEQGRGYAQQLTDWSEMDVPYIETSAKTGLNVDLIFKTLIENISYRQGAQYLG